MLTTSSLAEACFSIARNNMWKAKNSSPFIRILYNLETINAMIETSKVLMMQQWKFTPWLRTFHYYEGGQGIDIYGSFDRLNTPQSRLKCQPRVLTFTGSSLKDRFHGINTCTVNHLRQTTICNHVDFRTPVSLPGYSSPKKHIFIEELSTDDVIRHLCLSFSDCLCICSLNIEEAAQELSQWLRGQTGSPLERWPPVIFLLQSLPREADARQTLWDYCNHLMREDRLPEGFLEQVLEHCTFFEHDNKKPFDVVEWCLEASTEWLQRGWRRRKRVQTLWTLSQVMLR